MERDSLKPTDTERGQPILVLQASELSLDCGAAVVEAAEAARAARDEWL